MCTLYLLSSKLFLATVIFFVSFPFIYIKDDDEAEEDILSLLVKGDSVTEFC